MSRSPAILRGILSTQRLGLSTFDRVGSARGPTIRLVHEAKNIAGAVMVGVEYTNTRRKGRQIKDRQKCRPF